MSGAPDLTRAERPERVLEQLKLALEAGRMGTWYWSRVTGEVAWDETLESIYGFAPGGFPGTFEAYVERLHPEDRDRVLAAVQNSVDTKTGHVFEHRAVLPGGRVRWIEGRGRVVLDEEGEVEGMVGVAVDITERKRIEQRRDAQYAVARILAGSTTLEEATPALLEGICGSLMWDVGEFWMVDRSAGSLSCIAFRRSPWMPAETAFERSSRELTLGPGIGAPGKAWEQRSPVWVRFPEADPNEFPRRDPALELGLMTSVDVPILMRETVLGVLGILVREPRQPDDDLLRTLAAIANQIGQFIERTTVEAALRESEARERRSRDRAMFLAEASAELSGSLDYETTLARVAQLVVPRIADWCSVEMLGEDGSLQNLAVAHVAPSKVRLAEELRRRYPTDPDAPQGPPAVIRSGQPELVPVISEQMLDGAARDEEHRDLIRSLGVRSYMCVPLIARGRTIGAVAFVNEDLSRPFDDDDLALAEDLAGRAAMSIDNARLFRQRSHTARTLQRSLLPARLPEVPATEIAAHYRPAGEGMEVGGDFYDMFQADDGRWAFVVGDVCGKGAEAAALTALARHTIRAGARQALSPPEVLTVLNDAILNELADDRFCTVAYGELSLEDGPRLRLVSAGHPLPMFVRADGEVVEVGVPGTLLGWFEELELQMVEEKLAPGDALLLFTDGVTEERAGGEQFGEERLREVLAGTAGRSAQEIVDAVDRSVRDFSGELPRDDIAIVAIRRPS